MSSAPTPPADVVVKPELRSALLAGLLFGVFFLILMPICFLVAWYTWPVSFQILRNNVLTPRLFLWLPLVPFVFAFASFFVPRRSWTFQPDGVTVRSWSLCRFFPWSEIKYIEVGRFSLILRVSRWHGTRLDSVNGLACWDLIPVDKRRRVGFIKWRFWRA